MSSLKQRMLGPRKAVVARHDILAVLVIGLIVSAVLAMSVATPAVLIAWTNPV